MSDSRRTACARCPSSVPAEPLPLRLGEPSPQLSPASQEGWRPASPPPSGRAVPPPSPVTEASARCELTFLADP